MQSELGDLYQQLILDHNRRPHNFGTLEKATHRADGVNPLCGDRCQVSVQLDAGGHLAEVRFCGEGCAISRASASLMTCAVRGKSREAATELFEQFHALLAGDAAVDAAPLGKLAALGGVRAFPMRVKCATLAWHTLNAALQGAARPVSTEDDAQTAAPGAPLV